MHTRKQHKKLPRCNIAGAFVCAVVVFDERIIRRRPPFPQFRLRRHRSNRNRRSRFHQNRHRNRTRSSSLDRSSICVR